MTPEQERWAEALAVERMHGDDSMGHVAARVSELAAAGDLAGRDRWLAIGERLAALSRAARSG